jgi:hypothetical protein
MPGPMVTFYGFTPYKLFAAGEQGAWFDPSDLSTMWQDSAGSTPVTAVEQPVGKILDKSGRGNHATQATSGSRPTLSARVNLLNATATLSTQSVTTVAGTYILSFSGAGSITLSGTKTGTYSSGSNTLTSVTAGTLTLTVSGSVTSADLRLQNDGVGLPSYQRVTSSTDYDTTGFPLYLKFDGTDDYLTLANSCMSNLQASNQPVAIFAGARRDTGGAFMCLFGVADNTDATAGNNDSFAISFNSATSQIQANIRDYTGSFSDKSVTGGTYSAPSTCVATWARSSSTGYVAVNQVAGTAADQTQPALGLVLYTVGALRRGSTPTVGSYLNGRLYSLIIRAASTTAPVIARAEAWVNTRTRAY